MPPIAKETTAARAAISIDGWVQVEDVGEDGGYGEGHAYGVETE